MKKLVAAIICFSVTAAVAGPFPPPGVPDGRNGNPIRVDKLDPNGNDLVIFWDQRICDDPAFGHQIIFGGGQDLPNAPGGLFNVGGAQCGAGNQAPFFWGFSPDPLLVDPFGGMMWFLVLAEDTQVEGAWGRDGFGQERLGPQPGGFSGACGLSGKDTANQCGQGCQLDFLATSPHEPWTIEFNTPEVPPIPAGFFEIGSQPFNGQIELHGFKDGEHGQSDTKINRFEPFDLNAPPAQVPIQIVELHLVGVQPIQVITNDGPEPWLVSMGLSDNQNTGQLQVVTTQPQGGFFTTTLPIQPRLTFTREEDLNLLGAGLIEPEDVQVRIFDFGQEGLPPIDMGDLNQLPWTRDQSPQLDGLFRCDSETFHAGVDPANPVPPLACTPSESSALTSAGGAVNVGLCPAPIDPGNPTCDYVYIGHVPGGQCQAPLSIQLSCPGGDCNNCPNVLSQEFDALPAGKCVAGYSCTSC